MLVSKYLASSMLGNLPSRSISKHAEETRKAAAQNSNGRRTTQPLGASETNPTPSTDNSGQVESCEPFDLRANPPDVSTEVSPQQMTLSTTCDQAPPEGGAPEEGFLRSTPCDGGRTRRSIDGDLTDLTAEETFENQVCIRKLPPHQELATVEADFSALNLLASSQLSPIPSVAFLDLFQKEGNQPAVNSDCYELGTETNCAHPHTCAGAATSDKRKLALHCFSDKTSLLCGSDLRLEKAKAALQLPMATACLGAGRVCPPSRDHESTGQMEAASRPASGPQCFTAAGTEGNRFQKELSPAEGCNNAACIRGVSMGQRENEQGPNSNPGECLQSNKPPCSAAPDSSSETCTLEGDVRTGHTGVCTPDVSGKEGDDGSPPEWPLHVQADTGDFPGAEGESSGTHPLMGASVLADELTGLNDVSGHVDGPCLSSPLAPRSDSPVEEALRLPSRDRSPFPTVSTSFSSFEKLPSLTGSSQPDGRDAVGLDGFRISNETREDACRLLNYDENTRHPPATDPPSGSSFWSLGSPQASRRSTPVSGASTPQARSMSSSASPVLVSPLYGAAASPLLTASSAPVSSWALASVRLPPPLASFASFSRLRNSASRAHAETGHACLPAPPVPPTHSEERMSEDSVYSTSSVSSTSSSVSSASTSVLSTSSSVSFTSSSVSSTSSCTSCVSSPPSEASCGNSISTAPSSVVARPHRCTHQRPKGSVAVPACSPYSEDRREELKTSTSRPSHDPPPSLLPEAASELDHGKPSESLCLGTTASSILSSPNFFKAPGASLLSLRGPSSFFGHTLAGASFNATSDATTASACAPQSLAMSLDALEKRPSLEARAGGRASIAGNSNDPLQPKPTGSSLFRRVRSLKQLQQDVTVVFSTWTHTLANWAAPWGAGPEEGGSVKAGERAVVLGRLFWVCEEVDHAEEACDRVWKECERKSGLPNSPNKALTWLGRRAQRRGGATGGGSPTALGSTGTPIWNGTGPRSGALPPRRNSACAPSAAASKDRDGGWRRTSAALSGLLGGGGRRGEATESAIAGLHASESGASEFAHSSGPCVGAQYAACSAEKLHALQEPDDEPDTSLTALSMDRLGVAVAGRSNKRRRLFRLPISLPGGDPWPAGRVGCVSSDAAEVQHKLAETVRAIARFTYRSGFAPMYKCCGEKKRRVGPGFEREWIAINSDVGWGCTVRAAQMLLMQALRRHFLADDEGELETGKRGSRVKDEGEAKAMILRRFAEAGQATETQRETGSAGEHGRERDTEGDKRGGRGSSRKVSRGVQAAEAIDEEGGKKNTGEGLRCIREECMGRRSRKTGGEDTVSSSAARCEEQMKSLSSFRGDSRFSEPQETGTWISCDCGAAPPLGSLKNRLENIHLDNSCNAAGTDDSLPNRCRCMHTASGHLPRGRRLSTTRETLPSSDEVFASLSSPPQSRQTLDLSREGDSSHTREDARTSPQRHSASPSVMPRKPAPHASGEARSTSPSVQERPREMEDLLQWFLDVPSPPGQYPFSIFSFIRAAGGGIGWARQLYGELPLEEALFGAGRDKKTWRGPTSPSKPVTSCRGQTVSSGCKESSHLSGGSRDSQGSTFPSLSWPAASSSAASLPTCELPARNGEVDEAAAFAGVSRENEGPSRLASLPNAFARTSSLQGTRPRQEAAIGGATSTDSPLGDENAEASQNAESAPDLGRMHAATHAGHREEDENPMERRGLGKFAGEWFGPATASSAVKLLVEAMPQTKDELYVYVNSDGLLYPDEILLHCRNVDASSNLSALASVSSPGRGGTATPQCPEGHRGREAFHGRTPHASVTHASTHASVQSTPRGCASCSGSGGLFGVACDLSESLRGPQKGFACSDSEAVGTGRETRGPAELGEESASKREIPSDETCVHAGHTGCRASLRRRHSQERTSRGDLPSSIGGRAVEAQKAQKGRLWHVSNHGEPSASENLWRPAGGAAQTSGQPTGNWNNAHGASALEEEWEEIPFCGCASPHVTTRVSPFASQGDFCLPPRALAVGEKVRRGDPAATPDPGEPSKEPRPLLSLAPTQQPPRGPGEKVQGKRSPPSPSNCRASARAWGEETEGSHDLKRPPWNSGKGDSGGDTGGEESFEAAEEILRRLLLDEGAPRLRGDSEDSHGDTCTLPAGAGRPRRAPPSPRVLPEEGTPLLASADPTAYTILSSPRGPRPVHLLVSRGSWSVPSSPRRVRGEETGATCGDASGAEEPQRLVRRRRWVDRADQEHESCGSRDPSRATEQTEERTRSVPRRAGGRGGAARPRGRSAAGRPPGGKSGDPGKACGLHPGSGGGATEGAATQPQADEDGWRPDMCSSGVEAEKTDTEKKADSMRARDVGGEDFGASTRVGVLRTLESACRLDMKSEAKKERRLACVPRLMAATPGRSVSVQSGPGGEAEAVAAERVAKLPSSILGVDQSEDEEQEKQALVVSSRPSWSSPHLPRLPLFRSRSLSLSASLVSRGPQKEGRDTKHIPERRLRTPLEARRIVESPLLGSPAGPSAAAVADDVRAELSNVCVNGVHARREPVATPVSDDGCGARASSAAAEAQPLDDCEERHALLTGFASATLSPHTPDRTRRSGPLVPPFVPRLRALPLSLDALGRGNGGTPREGVRPSEGLCRVASCEKARDETGTRACNDRFGENACVEAFGDSFPDARECGFREGISPMCFTASPVLNSSRSEGSAAPSDGSATARWCSVETLLPGAGEDDILLASSGLVSHRNFPPSPACRCCRAGAASSTPRCIQFAGEERGDFGRKGTSPTNRKDERVDGRRGGEAEDEARQDADDGGEKRTEGWRKEQSAETTAAVAAGLQKSVTAGAHTFSFRGEVREAERNGGTPGPGRDDTHAADSGRDAQRLGTFVGEERDDGDSAWVSFLPFCPQRGIASPGNEKREALRQRREARRPLGEYVCVCSSSQRDSHRSSGVGGREAGRPSACAPIACDAHAFGPNECDPLAFGPNECSEQPSIEEGEETDGWRERRKERRGNSDGDRETDATGAKAKAVHTCVKPEARNRWRDLHAEAYEKAATVPAAEATSVRGGEEFRAPSLVDEKDTDAKDEEAEAPSVALAASADASGASRKTRNREEDSGETGETPDEQIDETPDGAAVDCLRDDSCADVPWRRGCLLLFPLTLCSGEKINPVYVHSLLAYLELPWSLGMVAGRGQQAFYCIGTQQKALLYLDPHSGIQPPALQLPAATPSFFAGSCWKVSDVAALNPSLAVAFFVRNERQLLGLAAALKKLEEVDSFSMLQVVERRRPFSPLDLDDVLQMEEVEEGLYFGESQGAQDSSPQAAPHRSDELEARQRSAHAQQGSTAKVGEATRGARGEFVKTGGTRTEGQAKNDLEDATVGGRDDDVDPKDDPVDDGEEAETPGDAGESGDEEKCPTQATPASSLPRRGCGEGPQAFAASSSLSAFAFSSSSRRSFSARSCVDTSVAESRAQPPTATEEAAGVHREIDEEDAALGREKTRDQSVEGAAETPGSGRVRGESEQQRLVALSELSPFRDDSRLAVGVNSGDARDSGDGDQQREEERNAGGEACVNGRERKGGALVCSCDMVEEKNGERDESPRAQLCIDVSQAALDANSEHSRDREEETIVTFCYGEFDQGQGVERMWGTEAEVEGTNDEEETGEEKAKERQTETRQAIGEERQETREEKEEERQKATGEEKEEEKEEEMEVEGRGTGRSKEGTRANGDRNDVEVRLIQEECDEGESEISESFDCRGGEATRARDGAYVAAEVESGTDR
ncbi:autophagy-related cysteine peptidase atg4, putative [Toxoplasma gondii ME49]|uniref:Autophagy-related cysteine peptidase atg4, putative n=2 Tax=Toxoplasma gondii TaxID=5811 RepID=S8F2H1_TOXGM|nr:autophagy-related cysteine peptidase atg4, putative [Toxoplasma gondii ME49]EPT29921.1 autophagy-related cysteine peptidase atg4, putative [Toxoplasma gondii ME49]|eukprot:XP_018637250.1 autophagy-related cysteine peptidase atg4, putative [Toxoplasma gondii ME49]